MASARKARTSTRLRFRVLRVLAVLGVFLVLGGIVMSRQNTHHFTVAPGQVRFVKITIPMRKLARGHEFVVDALPVVCRVGTTGPEHGGVHIKVVRTGHGIQKMWAELRIIVTSSAPPGKRKRLLDFSINGKGDWPQQTMIIDVE